MRRKRAIKRGRAISILLAAGAGYLIGSWNAAIVSGKEPFGAQSAAETIALRFPRSLSETPVVQAVGYERPTARERAADDAQLAVFAPEPMVPSSAVPSSAAPATAYSAAGSQPAILPAASQTADQPGPVQTADIAPLEPAPSADTLIAPKPKDVMSAAKPRPVFIHHQAKRPGYLLDDAQIADIKRRLHLTPDQERMWPGVEAALRNIGIAREREARLRGTGSIDPDSPQVQDLKSAAIPLLMSFSDEQKDEVRNLARGMGLEQLAAEF